MLGLPLVFERNVGQAPANFRFIAHAQDALVLVSSDRILVHENHRAKILSPNGAGEGVSAATVTMRLVGANPNAAAEAHHPLAARVNYFIGRDPDRWRRNVPTAAAVLIRDAWPGVDVEYRRDSTHAGNALECSFIVHLGGHPSAIRLAFDGVGNIRGWAHLLSLQSGIDGFSLEDLHVFQENAMGRHEIPARFVIASDFFGNSTRSYVAFKLGGYDPKIPLIIDPTLVYSTFVGGSGEPNAGTPRYGTGDSANALALDAAGNEYLTGSTSSPNFPATNSGFPSLCPASQSCNPAFVTKINGQTGQIIYSTFLGGSFGGNQGGAGDQGNGIAVDSSGDAYVTGAAYSTDFPTTTGAYLTTCSSDQNAFAAKLSPDGGSLVYSTMVFCTGTIGYGSAIAVDAAGNAYIAGTDSLQTFTGILNPTGSALTYSIILASSYGNALAVSSDGKIFIGGRALDTDFPTTPHGYHHNCSKCAKKNPAFVSVLDPSLGRSMASLTYSTILGGSDLGDSVNGMVADPEGRVWVVGTAGKGGFHGKTKFGHKTCSDGICGSKAFVALIDPSKQGAASLVYSAALAGDGSDTGKAIALDASGTVYVGGSTSSTNFPITAGAVQSSYAPCTGCGPYRAAAFVSVLLRGDRKLEYSTYLGGAQVLPPTDSFGHYIAEVDSTNSIGVDSSGVIHAAGVTYATGFPVSANAQQAVCKACATLGSNAFISHLNPAPLNSSPALQYSSFVGGSGPGFSGDSVSAIASDNSGATYLAGTAASPDFPTTSGAFEPTCPACIAQSQQDYVSTSSDSFIAKLDLSAAPGDQLIYATYLGTSIIPPPDNFRPNSWISGITVDSNGEAYVVGSTISSTFPVTANAFQTVCNGACAGAFFSKLDSTGSNLLYSTYLAGSLIDQAVGVAINAQGDALIAGHTSSKDFPITANAFQTTCVPCGAVYASTYGGFVSEINPAASGASSLLYSSFLSGTGTVGDSIAAMTSDSSGDIVVTGIAASADFPVTANAFQSAPPVPLSGFVSVINPAASGAAGLKYSTWLGASTGEVTPLAIQTDSDGDILVGGVTPATDLPVTPNAFQKICPDAPFGVDCNSGFVVELNPSFAPASQLVYGTFLGGATLINGSAIVWAVGEDTSGRIYAAGQTASGDFPVTPDAVQQTCFACGNGGGGNAFLTVIDPSLAGSSALVYSTFLGGDVADVANSLLVTPSGLVAIAGRAASPNFPITAGALESTCPACRYPGTGDGFLAEFQF